MSAADESHKSLRYRLGELLRDTLGPPPAAHGDAAQGRPGELQPLPAAARRRRLRRRAVDPRGDGPPARALLPAPHQGGDGLLPGAAARTAPGRPSKIFTKRIPHTVDFQIDGAEFELYRDVTRFVKRQSARAAAEGDDPRARAVGFLMSLYQRRLASSTYAMRRSLENRARRLEEGLKRAQDLARHGAAGPSRSGRARGDGGERARAAGGDARGDHARRQRRAGARGGRRSCASWPQQAAGGRGRRRRGEALASSRSCCRSEGFFDHPDQRLLLFTEFKDTLDYLVEHARSPGASASAASTAA